MKAVWRGDLAEEHQGDPCRCPLALVANGSRTPMGTKTHNTRVRYIERCCIHTDLKDILPCTSRCLISADTVSVVVLCLRGNNDKRRVLHMFSTEVSPLSLL